MAQDLLRVGAPPSGGQSLPHCEETVGKEEKAEWWEGGTLWVTSSEKTDLDVLGAGLFLPTYGEGGRVLS